MTQALHRHWWEAAGTQKGGLASWAALAAAPVIGAAEQLPGVSRSVRAGLLGGGEAAAWSQLGLV